MRSENLKVRVGQKLRDQGIWPLGIPGERGIIGMSNMGDLIHWTEKHSVIEAAESDPLGDVPL